VSAVWSLCGALLAYGATVTAVGAGTVVALRGLVNWLDRP